MKVKWKETSRNLNNKTQPWAAIDKVQFNVISYSWCCFQDWIKEQNSKVYVYFCTNCIKRFLKSSCVRIATIYRCLHFTCWLGLLLGACHPPHSAHSGRQKCHKLHRDEKTNCTHEILGGKHQWHDMVYCSHWCSINNTVTSYWIAASHFTLPISQKCT